MKRKTQFKNYPWGTWRADRRATQKQISEAVRTASEDISQAIDLLSDKQAFERQCGYMQGWAWSTAVCSLRTLARQNLEYWRYRAFMDGAYSMPRAGDREAAAKWDAFA